MAMIIIKDFWKVYFSNTHIKYFCLCIVAYLCHHLSDLYVISSDLYVVLSDFFMLTCQIFILLIIQVLQNVDLTSNL